jgi:lysophospholipase L1-like esterase
MFRHNARRKIGTGRAFIALLGCTLLAQTASQSPNRAAHFNPPKRYYLALGDSISYGYQDFKAQANAPPSAFNTGYVDVFSAQLRELQPRITTVNYGCPGESTESFVHGGCLWTALGRQLHDGYSGSQLDAAVAFLRAHRGQVSPVTLTIGSNDVRTVLDSCTFNQQVDLICVQGAAPAFIAELVRRISNIIGQLRSAAPDAEMIVTGAWNPFVAALGFADSLFQGFNASLARAAAANGARFADPFPIFNPQGDPAAEIAALCTLTLLCTNGDSHPSDAGYRALAAVVFDASEYSRLRSR